MWKTTIKVAGHPKRTRTHLRWRVLCTVGALTLTLTSPIQTAQADLPTIEAHRKLYLDALQLQSRNELSASRNKLRRVVRLMEKEFGKMHPELTIPLQSLAYLEYGQSDFHAARVYWARTVTILEQSKPNSESMRTALEQLGSLHHLRGDHRKGEAILERGLLLTEKLHGKRSIEYANWLDTMGGYEQLRNAYNRAESLFQQAHDIRKKLPPGPAVKWTRLSSLYRLGSLHMIRGRQADAEKLFQQVLEFYRTADIPNSIPQQASSLESIARLYDKSNPEKAAGYLDEALKLHLQNVKTNETKYGKDSTMAASAYSLIATHYGQRKQYKEQLAALVRATAIYKKQYADMPRIMSAYNMQHGTVLQNLKRYPEAERMFRRVLSVAKATNQSLEGISVLYAELFHEWGKYRKAEHFFRQALKARAKTWGDNHYQSAWPWDRLGTNLRAQSRFNKALDAYTRSYELVETQLHLVLSSGSEADKLKFLSNCRHHIDTTISLHLQDMPTSAEAATLAMTTILRRKGRVLDAVSDSFNALRRRIEDKDKPMLEQLSAARSRLSALVMKGKAELTIPEYARRIETLEGTIRSLEIKLSTRYRQFKAQTTPITTAAVQAAIPDKSVLIDWVIYKSIDARKVWDEQSTEERYAAYILRRGKPPTAIDLGPVKPIDSVVGRLREALADPDRDDVIPLARTLDKLTMGKLRPHLGAAERLFIAPDGALNLVPFGALVDENEAFLVQRYAMTYLTSGRDLIRLSVNAKPRTNPVVLANPDFAGSSPKATPTGATQSSSPVRGRRSAGLSMSEWSALPGTANEAEALANLLGSLTLLTGSNATENALKQVRSPSLLHIATHGFFLESRHDKENPLLRSGLILSGANKLASDDQDGVLTALEASGLSLWGTQMVVLSACQTGLGSIRSGEGVYGLRRALVIAGSESQVMSLWQVDDEATKDLMIGFYKRLQQGLGRSDALRASQLRLLENPEYAHPFFWASFIGSGHWTPLATN